MEKIVYMADSVRELPRILSMAADGASGLFAVVDCNVAGRFAPVLEAAGVEWLPFRAGEEYKTIEAVESIAGWLLEHEADREALLVGIGGGVTTDITGFTASVYKRGIRYMLVPTTLLAQADAAVGGKTGVDLQGYKNALGTFGTPEAVCIGVDVLDTLPETEVRSGMAEVLKTLIIGDADLFREVVNRYGSQPGRIVEAGKDAEMCGRIVRRCVEIKSGIVEADRTERGGRMRLNLGHTLGHALESLCIEAGRPVPHGEAVAAGIMAAADISVKKGLLSSIGAAEIKSAFKSLGYRDLRQTAESRVNLPEEKVLSKLADFVLNDKKRKEDFINFVLISGLGSVEVNKLNVNEIQEVINDLY